MLVIGRSFSNNVNYNLFYFGLLTMTYVYLSIIRRNFQLNWRGAAIVHIKNIVGGCEYPCILVRPISGPTGGPRSNNTINLNVKKISKSYSCISRHAGRGMGNLLYFVRLIH